MPKTAFILNEIPIEDLCEQKKWATLSNAIMDESFPNNFMTGTHARPHDTYNPDDKIPDYTACGHLIKKLKELCQDNEDSSKFMAFLMETENWLKAKQKTVDIIGKKIAAQNENKQLIGQMGSLDQRMEEINQSSLSALSKKTNQTNVKIKILQAAVIILTSMLVLSIAAMFMVSSTVSLSMFVMLSIGMFVGDILMSKYIEQSKEQVDDLEIQLDEILDELNTSKARFKKLDQKFKNNCATIKRAIEIEMQCCQHRSDMLTMSLSLFENKPTAAQSRHLTSEDEDTTSSISEFSFLNTVGPTHPEADKDLVFSNQ